MDIREHLAKRGIKQMDLAKALGVSQQMASLLATGKRKVPISKLKAFEKATGLSRRQFRPELFR